MIPVIKLHEDETQKVYLLSDFYFDTVHRAGGTIHLENNKKRVLYTTVAANTRKTYQAVKNQPPPQLCMSLNIPILAPYSCITFTEGFEPFNLALDEMAEFSTLKTPEDRIALKNKLTEAYQREYPNAFFYCQAFDSKYYGVQGYFVFIDGNKAIGVLWAFEDQDDFEQVDFGLDDEDEVI